MQKELVYRKKGKKLHKQYKLYYVWEFSQAILFDALRNANKQTEKGRHRNNQDILHYTKLWQIRGGKHPLAYYDMRVVSTAKQPNLMIHLQIYGVGNSQ